MVKWILATSVLVLTYGQHTSHAQARPRQIVTQGQEWVAFDADYTSPGIYGRYYRASDGSMRQEGADPDGKRPSFISIINIARKEAYFYSSQRGTWSVQPVIMPADGYQPLGGDPLLTSGHRQLQNVQRRPQRADLFVPPAEATLTRIEKPLTLVATVTRFQREPQYPFGRGPEPIPEKP